MLTVMPAPRALVSPTFDKVAVGGLLLLGFGVLALIGGAATDERGLWMTILILSAALNFPHFMASYRLLYSARDRLRAHWVVGVLVPAAILAWVGASLYMGLSRRDAYLYNLLEYVAAIWLAWHYTGQTWGVTAAFAGLAGTPLKDRDRTLVRGALRVFLVWHVVLYHVKSHNYPPFLWFLEPLMPLLEPPVAVAAHFAVVAALYGVLRAARRAGKPVASEAVLPIAALYAGYALFAAYGHFWLIALQLMHAGQYLLFAGRVEANRHGRTTRHMLAWYAACAVIGWLLFDGATAVSRLGWAPSLEMRFVAANIAAAIGLHHFIVDGRIWKLSNPAVRRDLFAHLPKVAPLPQPSA